jgi:asparagine synthase (glutamine-hydrolysing)
MCGIAGSYDPRRRLGHDAAFAAGAAMGREIVHRGPDDEGVHVEEQGDVVLSFRRLSIIDLSEAGHQPMVSASGRSVIVFNGEIYNAEDLRPELAARGLNFRGHSDTEILLEAFEAWGVEATLARVVGMFAIAFFDRNTRQLTLARDRLGKKPLYVARQNGLVLFASQPRCFRAHPLFEPQLDRGALSAFLRMGYVPAPLSIYRDVEQLRPGEMAVVHPDGRLDKTRYWRAEDVAEAAKASLLEGDDRTLLDALEAQLSSAVTKRMVADVPLGAFLSGGIDSSVVVALMQASSSKPVKTFSIGFHVEGFDEAPHARAVAEHLGTDHHELYLTAEDALATIPELAEHYDEPFADSSQVPTLLVSRMARKHVTVALSGDGGDELFAGYSRYTQMTSIMGVASKAPGLFGAVAGAGHALLTHKASRPLRGALPPVLRARAERWLSRMSQVVGEAAFEAAYLRIVQQGLDPSGVLVGVDEPMNDIWKGSLARAFPGVAERCQMIDTLSYLPDDILVKVDRASMAVGLEARAPLLDHELFRFVWSLPYRMKVRDGVTKWALREVLYRHVPQSIVDRPKMGFGVPIGTWLRGPLREWAEDLLSPDALSQDDLFQVVPVRDLWARHLAGENWQYPIWSILMAQAWRRRWLSGARARAAA